MWLQRSLIPAAESSCSWRRRIVSFASLFLALSQRLADRRADVGSPKLRGDDLPIWPDQRRGRDIHVVYAVRRCNRMRKWPDDRLRPLLALIFDELTGFGVIDRERQAEDRQPRVSAKLLIDRVQQARSDVAIEYPTSCRSR